MASRAQPPPGTPLTLGQSCDHSNGPQGRRAAGASSQGWLGSCAFYLPKDPRT